jgi:hypothetical protein
MANRDINSLYELFRDIVRKERSVFIKIPQFNTYMDSGQLDAVEEWFAPYGDTQRLHDALRKLRVYLPFTSDYAGFVNFPSDYLHLIGNPFTVTGSTTNQIKFVNEAEFAFAIRSKGRPVTNSYPIAIDTSSGFSIYPQQEQVGYLWYLKRPATIKLAYTQLGRTVTYDPAGSVQPDFSDAYLNNILAKALRYAGVYIDEQGVSDFANQYNQETR